ncbi:hypothetical protein GWI33_007111 [Rhynchophorus ferrugineus]|uniref:Uncharacterized protein n=1 Tax=Rhynchophorus ferrugineus TaxID=354439 RepID=A0A834IGB1_RHYFE|nr:hypothetical protein GWI33_007111 [Rhynchophorus ferrugineus]
MTCHSVNLLSCGREFKNNLLFKRLSSNSLLFLMMIYSVEVCEELSYADTVTSMLPVANKETEDESKINQHECTIKDARNALDAIKCIFLKKSGLSDGLVKSITELDCTLDNYN